MSLRECKTLKNEFVRKIVIKYYGEKHFLRINFMTMKHEYLLANAMTTRN